MHVDAKSRTGVIIMICGGAVCAISRKQKLVTKSSTEAELVALSDGSTYVLWLRNLLGAQGYTMAPSVIFQDNQSVLAMLRETGSNSLRTRHINIRYYFIRDRAANGEVKLMYLGTADMLADLMTKPILGELFRKLVGRIIEILI